MPTAAELARKDALEELRLLDVKDAAQDDPKALINEIRFFDPSTDQWVEFRMFPPAEWEPPVIWLPGGDFKFNSAGAFDWFWQALIVDWLHDPERKKYLIYKARQLGITLLCCAYALWLMLYRPGSACVAYSYEEGEATKLVQASWQMFTCLPEVLRSHVEVVKPKPGMAELPSQWIVLRHPDKRLSSFQALPATPKHGHGTRITFAIMDEVARMDYARGIYTAINPATSRGHAKLAMISTANGVSNQETGEGNFFHHLYATKEEKGLEYVFLPWNLEPTRDEAWYQREAMALDEVERNQQYPLNEADGFMLSGANYFNREALSYYRAEAHDPTARGQFVVVNRRKAKFMHLRDGIVNVYEKPHPEGEYAIGIDVATGRGTDYTVGTVLDLSSGAIVATFRAKMEAPRAAIQAHYLGKWYNNAKIAVERQGGYGEALIIALRDGNENLPAYSNLYRHVKYDRGNRPISEEYGHPMGPSQRGNVVEYLKACVRERLFPWIPAGSFIDEMGTFIYAETTPSPRAQDGCNDDCVMSLGLACAMYRMYGSQPSKRKWKKSHYKPHASRAAA